MDASSETPFGLALDDRDAEQQATLGLQYLNAGSRELAENALRKALQLAPERAEIEFVLAGIARDNGDTESAIACLVRCADLTPSSFAVQLALGRALAERGRFEQAVGHFQTAMALNPSSSEACLQLAEVFRRLGRLSPARAMARRVVAIAPQSPAGHLAEANLFAEERRFDEAIERFTRSLALDPQHAEAHDNLAHVYFRLGRVEEAISSYRRAVSANPADPVPHSALVYVAGFHPEWTQEQVLAEARAWAQVHAEPLRTTQRPHQNHPDPERKLRIGYVSGDFDNHCQRFFTLPLLRQHSREQVEVICYSSVQRADEWTERVRALADGWADVHGLSDAALAERIRQDAVDVLIDLTMHMPKGRLLTFAAKPAPVQICWLAYPGTTGLAAMDFRITDPQLDPLDAACSFYVERPLHLPHAFWCYDPGTEEPLVGPLPALATGRLTFGCLNDFCKVNAPVLELWARVLVGLPDSRLLLLAPPGSARRWVSEVLSRSGVASERVEFVDRQPHDQYLRTYHRIDVVLDCLPANGHTTSFDSLWMGVPVVTLVGKTVLGRAGLCQAQQLGLSELVAQTPDQFVEIALSLAGDLERLNGLRRSLRERMRASPLMDAAGFARGFEGACRRAWRDWCGRQSAAGLVAAAGSSA